MRLKIYTGSNLAEAMERVRYDLGDDAVIMSIDSDEDGTHITAALDGPEPEPFAPQRELRSERPDMGELEAELRQALTYHGVPSQLTDRIVYAASTIGAETTALSLAGGLDLLFNFAPLSTRAKGRPIAFIGPPGAGKTLCVAKLATRARRAGRFPTVVTTDIRRAGGIEQLEAFTRILELDLITAGSPEELSTAVERCSEGAVYIDTFGVNPFLEDDIALIRQTVETSGAEPILVLPAGGDAMEAVEAAAAFATAGAKRLIATRLDACRRMGGVVAALDAARLAFADASVSPQPADPLVNVNPVTLARLILPHANKNSVATLNANEAVP